MKYTKYLLLTLVVFAIGACEKAAPDNSAEEKALEPAREVYQLKTYTLATDEQVLATDKYLSEAYLPGLKRLRIEQVGVFKPKSEEVDTVRRIFVLVPFSSLEQFIKVEEELGKDDVYLTAGADYLNATYELPPYVRLESVLLRAFEDMPAMHTPQLDGPREDRIYELRSYESPTENYYMNKVDMFNAGGEIKLFDRLQFNAVFYGEVISGPKMPNLMYMTSFSDQVSRDGHWDEFVESPEWKELSAMPKYKNNISHIDISFLYPTEYSDY